MGDHGKLLCLIPRFHTHLQLQLPLLLLLLLLQDHSISCLPAAQRQRIQLHQHGAEAAAAQASSSLSHSRSVVAKPQSKLEMMMMMMMKKKKKKMSSNSKQLDSSTSRIPALFLFSDSLGDTGNGPFVNHPRAYSLPFGETFPGYANGRFSDGRAIVGDFLAGHLGLRPLNPWLDVFLDFDEGANYAIPGATVLPDFMPLALPQQIEWHLDLVALVRNRTTTNSNYPSSSSFSSSPSSSSSSSPSSSSSSANSPAARELDYDQRPARIRSDEARKRLPSPASLRDALYVLQIGGLDYKMSYDDEGLPLDYVNSTLVPKVVAGLKEALETLYESAGARRLVVMGVGAQGCMSAALATFPELERDSNGCISAINSITWNSAQQTLAMMRELAQLRLDASYTFVDLHSATIHIVDHALAFGFSEPYDACCGAGSRYPYGFNYTVFICSNDTQSLYVCPDPKPYINWDGIHFTDTFNFQLFNHTFLTGAFMYPVLGLSAISKRRRR